MGEPWTKSVFSDGSRAYVSNPSPALGETVTVSLRVAEEAPVECVFLRTAPNGAETYTRAARSDGVNGLVYFRAQLTVNEPEVCYSFLLVAEGRAYTYTQAGLSITLQGCSSDFRLLATYTPPAWVKSAVFYQIFPDRFRNGDPTNDVKTGEFSLYGFRATKWPWKSSPPDYAKGGCMDFFGGDLQGVEDMLGYFKVLGVNALYLNPIFRAPSTHKYDCIDFMHVDEHLGGDEALASLCQTLHQNGMRIILDISINHTGSAHRWFNREGQFFPLTEGAYNNPDCVERRFYRFQEDGSYQSWWGVESLPVLDYSSQELRDRLYRGQDSVLRKWLRPPYSIDGWRFDVADVMARYNERQLSHEVWREIREVIREENPEAYILAEDWGDCNDHLRGDEWDAPMNYFTCARPIRQFVGESDLILERYLTPRQLSRRMSAKELAVRLTVPLQKRPYILSQNLFNLLDSHDVSRLHNNATIDGEALRGAILLQYTLTGAPCLYYGDEAGIDGRLGSNEGCRYPMPWDTGFESSDLFRLYRRLNRLRLTAKALQEGAQEILYAEGYAIAIARYLENICYITAVSMHETPIALPLPLARLGKSRPARVEDETGRKLNWRDGTLVLRPHEAVLFKVE